MDSEIIYSQDFFNRLPDEIGLYEERADLRDEGIEDERESASTNYGSGVEDEDVVLGDSGAAGFRQRDGGCDATLVVIRPPVAAVEVSRSDGDMVAEAFGEGNDVAEKCNNWESVESKDKH
ncbi:hypothetical protein ACS0TY_005343 [Phlomoides rotata]